MDHQVADNNGGSEGKEHNNERIPLMALNHVSRLCKSVEKSVDFYRNLLGFVPMKRPDSFDFNGAWLFNYGVGVHLVQAPDSNLLPKVHRLDPLDNHISFQCEDAGVIEEKLKEMNIEYIKRNVETDDNDDDGSSIDQLFFNDPDGFMIEICNCENLKLVPLECDDERIRLVPGRHNPPVEIGNKGKE
ncbi:glyoxylase I 4-like [Impatiens glandulifera]|uniref:glyoxylase I 4-like n=1 Tax=Impatiens glandulifera TaxID=253017 RepID=UPI001FB04BFD|nr:glyoxylase I 4-like [Impatiens glandulifera]